MDAETRASAEGIRLRRQTGTHGSLRKGTEGYAVGQSISNPTATPIRTFKYRKCVNHNKFLKKSTPIDSCLVANGHPESFLISEKDQSADKLLIQILNLNSFRDEAIKEQMFL